MSYIGYEFMYDGTRAAFWGYIQTAMINMGWELHDNISATVKVYKSNGESGNEHYGYVWIDAGTGAIIAFAFYQYWNSASHTGVRQKLAGGSSTWSQLGAASFQALSPGMIVGDKNLVFITPNIGIVNTAQYGIIFGHLPVRFDNNITNAQGTAGTAGTITIASSAGQGVGKRIQIVGDEGCDSLIITASPDATTRKLIALPRNYGTGAVIGSPATTFGCGYVTSNWWFPVSMWGDAGTTVGTTYLYAQNISSPALGSLSFYNEGKYYLTPIYIVNILATIPGHIMGSLGNNFLCGITPAAMDMMILNNDGSFPEVNLITGLTANTISDSTRSWAVNAHAGKFCCLTNGPGIGLVKKISSNTSDTLTVDSNWPSTYYPSGGTEFKIVDVVYRGHAGLFSLASYIKITQTSVPA
ncbi:MAG TPA: hypothetical protein PLW50_00830 [Smithellaceae bacterium]|nr:hypothetical protein [Smithellaceae bacterium]